MNTTPTYADWEVFWKYHITDEFRVSFRSCSDFPCNALAQLDDWRDFFHKLLGELAVVDGENKLDAPLPVSLNALYVQIAQHFTVEHPNFPEITDESGVAEQDVSALNSVLDALLSATDPIGHILRTVMRSKMN